MIGEIHPTYAFVLIMWFPATAELLKGINTKLMLVNYWTSIYPFAKKIIISQDLSV